MKLTACVVKPLICLGMFFTDSPLNSQGTLELQPLLRFSPSAQPKFISQTNMPSRDADRPEPQKESGWLQSLGPYQLWKEPLWNIERNPWIPYTKLYQSPKALISARRLSACLFSVDDRALNLSTV